MKQKLFFFLSMLLLFSSVKSQTLIDYTWRDYKMKFKIYDNMTVIENSSEKFEVKDDNINFTIYPKKGESLSHGELITALKNWAVKNDLVYDTYNVNGDEQPIKIKNNGYWGYGIDGKKDNYPTSLFLIVDPDYPEISFYIYISYRAEYFNDIEKIIESITPI